MTTLAVRKTTWQGLDSRDRQILRHLGEVLELGQPAEYETPALVPWYVFDDHRFDPTETAYLGCVVANLGEIPGGYTVPLTTGGTLDEPQLRSDTRTFCEGSRTNPLVLPADVTFTEDGNPWQEILDAQNTPAAVRMGSGVPENWTPVDDN